MMKASTVLGGDVRDSKCVTPNINFVNTRVSTGGFSKNRKVYLKNNNYYQLT
jgi:hypothetical protein